MTNVIRKIAQTDSPKVSIAIVGYAEFSAPDVRGARVVGGIRVLGETIRTKAEKNSTNYVGEKYDEAVFFPLPVGPRIVTGPANVDRPGGEGIGLVILLRSRMPL